METHLQNKFWRSLELTWPLFTLMPSFRFPHDAQQRGCWNRQQYTCAEQWGDRNISWSALWKISKYIILPSRMLPGQLLVLFPGVTSRVTGLYNTSCQLQGFTIPKCHLAAVIAVIIIRKSSRSNPDQWPPAGRVSAMCFWVPHKPRLNKRTGKNLWINNRITRSVLRWSTERRKCSRRYFIQSQEITVVTSSSQKVPWLRQ